MELFVSFILLAAVAAVGWMSGFIAGSLKGADAEQKRQRYRRVISGR